MKNNKAMKKSKSQMSLSKHNIKVYHNESALSVGGGGGERGGGAGDMEGEFVSVEKWGENDMKRK